MEYKEFKEIWDKAKLPYKKTDCSPRLRRALLKAAKGDMSDFDNARIQMNLLNKK